jgi:hypothetical protein
MRKRRWLGLVLAAAILLLAKAGVSGALEHGWARRSLLARLSASFGRPVDVGRFQMNLLSGLRLEADSVTVAEDPRFGQEYFLRAEQLTAGLRWTALLRGRIEFGIVSLSRPSLNLVRLPDGSWNIESWLPPANQPFPVAAAARADGSAPPGPALSQIGHVAARLSRLYVNGGRINFKLGAEKLPFALVDVNGNLEQDSSGRWSIDLQADPMRAPVPLQNAGMFRLQGTVAGTSARLRPATFVLTWQDASLADALRLADGTDHGVRGALSAQLSATIASSPVPATGAGNAGSQWNLQGTLRLSGVHRWDLGESPLDPAVNATLAADWRPGEPRLQVTRCIVEAPQSRLNATGSLDWSHGLDPNVQFVSSRVGFGDLLAWRRAFLPGIADDSSIEGAVTVDASLAGWPPRLRQADASSSGAVVHTQALPGPLRIGHVEASLQKGLLVFGPASVSLPGAGSREAPRNAPAPAPVGAFQIAGVLGPTHPGDSPRDWRYKLSVSGDTQRVQDLIALAGAFGRPANPEWSVEGPVALKLAWTGALHRGTSAANGTLELRGLQLSSVALNQPLIVGAASVALKSGERDIHLAAVQALGAHWTGSLRRRVADGAWDFDLSADRLDPAELDRWLRPDQPGLLGRILPFTVSRSGALSRAAVFARLAARGRLRVGEVLLAPLRIGKLDADAEVDGRRIVLRRAQADFYGGRLSGELNALLAAEPFYSFRGRIDRVDLASLTNASVPLTARFAGLVAGELTFEARGIGREPLAESLEGEGVLRVRNAMVRGLDLSPDQIPGQKLPAPGRAGDSEPAAEARYSTAAATFHVADGRVLLNQVLLVGRDEQLELDGTVSFARQLDLRVRPQSRDLASRDLARSAEIDAQDTDADIWAIVGTLDAPQVRLQTPVAGGRAVQADRPILPGARR